MIADLPPLYLIVLGALGMLTVQCVIIMAMILRGEPRECEEDRAAGRATDEMAAMRSR